VTHSRRREPNVKLASNQKRHRRGIKKKTIKTTTIVMEPDEIFSMTGIFLGWRSWDNGAHTGEGGTFFLTRFFTFSYTFFPFRKETRGEN
jgi:hypothetical protein